MQKLKSNANRGTKLVEIFSFWDLQLQRTVSFSPKELDEKLEEFSVLLEKHVNRLKEISGYELTSFTVKIALKGNVFVASAEGGIELKFEKPRIQKAT